MLTNVYIGIRSAECRLGSTVRTNVNFRTRNEVDERLGELFTDTIYMNSRFWEVCGC